jgi:serine/threonine protein kinase
VVAFPVPGAKLDDFVIDKVILKSRRFQLYRAEDRESGEKVALRFPEPASTASAQAFLREERIARRIESPYILRPIALRPGRRTALYSALEYRHTEKLTSRIRRKHGLRLPEALHLGEHLLAALETLHANGVIHGDVRANNLFYDKFTHQLWMLGLGADRGETITEDGRKLRSGTLSYRAPELFDGAKASERSDIYAAGVTIYRMLSAKYPYGKIRSADDWREPRHYTPLRNHDESLPAELDSMLERACAIDPQQRYASVEPFTAALSAAHARSAINIEPKSTQADTDRAAMRWSWWLTAAMVCGLIAYLYFALR